MDNEISGSGNQYDYGFRIYNPRIGKFLSVDPLTQTYPWYTPYQFAGNKPIANIDLDGLEEIDYHYVIDGGYRTKLAIEKHSIKKIEKLNPAQRYFNDKVVSVQNWWKQWAGKDVLAFSDLDDATVIVWDQHIDGEPADGLDQGLAAGSLAAPIVGNKIAKFVVKKIEYLKYLKANGYSAKVASAIVERGALRTSLKIASKTTEAHHLIPVKVLKENKVVQDAVEAGFNFNSATNGIPIDKALHGSHSNYTDFVQKELDQWATKNDGFSPTDARAFVQNELIPKLEKLVDKAVKSKTSLQEAFKQ